MNSATFTIGRFLLPKASSHISAFLCTTDDKGEYVEKALYDGVADHIQDVHIQKSNFRSAREGYDHKRYGYWSDLTVTSDKTLLIKIFCQYNTPSNKIKSAGFYTLRKGGAVSKIIDKKCHHEVHDTNHGYQSKYKITTRSRIIATGVLEEIDLKDAELLYGVKTPVIFRSFATNIMRNRLLGIEEIASESVSAPKIERVEVVNIQGERVEIARRKRNIRRLF